MNLQSSAVKTDYTCLW